jgi:hypothetical protein
MEHCYMCGRQASSKEHVPPRNLFPENKDVEGENYRINLITVPSCDLHNMGKAQDDEFLMVSLAGVIGNNSIGYRHKFGKVNRAIHRSSNRLLDNVIVKKKKIYVVEFERNKFVDVIWGAPDIKRLNKCFDSIVRGLHFHHFNKSFEGEIKLLLGFLTHKDNSPKNFQQFIKDKVELELIDKQKYGSNPEVFFYQVTDKDQFGLYLFRLCFYGGLDIYAALTPKGAVKPLDLGAELLNGGIKTIIHLGEKTYEIN